jgi:hypothetical protein
MNTEAGIDPAEDLRQQLRAQLGHATMSPDLRKRKLLLWCIRQLLLCTFAWFFWEHAWMRWAFAIGIVFAGVHLVLLFLMPVLLARKVARTERAIDRMSEALKAAEQDNPTA